MLRKWTLQADQVRSKSMFKEVVFWFEGIFIYHAILILKAVVLLLQVTGYFNIIKGDI